MSTDEDLDKIRPNPDTSNLDTTWWTCPLCKRQLRQASSHMIPNTWTGDPQFTNRWSYPLCIFNSMLDRNNKGAGGSALHVQYDVCAECSVMPPEPKLPTIRATLTAAQVEHEYRRTRPLSDHDATDHTGTGPWNG